MTNAILWTIGLLILLAIVVAVFAWFYQRATNEVALVRTGAGGRKVVLDGGVLAIPYFHEVSRVNMQTLRLDVQRAGEAALITKDRLRVDVGVEFYLSVSPSGEAVARAAQTLGRRTFQPEQLRDLIEGMFIDALRAVAARLTLDELHENRGGFVSEVRRNLADVLERYGLQIDSVSLTALDQTPIGALDENNAFNAVGMRRLAEVIAKSKKERAEIDAEAEVSVRRAAMEASKRKLEIDLEARRAEIAQQQEVETLLAAQLAEVARRKADGEREAAQARIKMEQDIEAADIARERELATQRTEAASTRAEAARAEATIDTAQAVAEAERAGQVAAVSAKTRREDADARKYEQLAEVEARKARIAADNGRSADLVAMETELAKLDALPKIVAEMVKPAEKINDINIHHLSGFGGVGGDYSSDKSPINQAVDAIMEMAVQMPALKKLGEQVGASLATGEGGDKG